MRVAVQPQTPGPCKTSRTFLTPRETESYAFTSTHTNTNRETHTHPSKTAMDSTLHPLLIDSGGSSREKTSWGKQTVSRQNETTAMYPLGYTGKQLAWTFCSCSISLLSPWDHFSFSTNVAYGRNAGYERLTHWRGEGGEGRGGELNTFDKHKGDCFKVKACRCKFGNLYWQFSAILPYFWAWFT